MKAAISGWLISALIVLCNVTSFAQTTPPVSGATLVGTFSLESLLGDDEPELEGDVNTSTTVEVSSWLTQGGETIFSMNVNSMTFSTPCGWAATISLKTLMDEVAQDVLKKAASLGYITCTICPVSSNYKVYYPTCVQRNVSGSCPVITAATGSTFSYNTYSICCTAGLPTVTLVSATCGSGGCGTGYELTCW